MKDAALPCLIGLTLALGTVGCSTTPAPGPSTPAMQEPAPQIAGLTGKNLVTNGDFEAGDFGWNVVARQAQVIVDRSGRDGSAGLVVRALEDTRVRAVYDLGRQDLPRGSQLEAATWLRASLVGQEVQLSLDEIQGRSGYQPVRETVRTYDRAWETVRTTAVTEWPDSRLRLRVDVKHLPAGASIRLDDVWVSRTRPILPVDASSDRLDNGCAVTSRGVPVCSAYLGAAYGRNHDPAAWERSMGHRLGVRRTHFAADEVEEAVVVAQRDLAAGRLPWISLEVPYSWARMADGRGDRWVRAVARWFAELPGPVWLAFHPDPAGDGNVRSWTRMQERLAPMIRSAPNIAYTVILGGWFTADGEREYRLRSVWPRRAEIDVAGFELFDYEGASEGADPGRTTSLAKTYFEPLSRWAERRRVAWAVAATGYSHTAAERDPTWLYRTFQRLLHHGGVAFTYRNGTGRWALRTPEKRRQFEYAIRHSPQL